MRAGVYLLALCSLAPRAALGFYERAAGDFTLELRGNARINYAQGRLPAIEGLPEALAPPRELRAPGGILRLIAAGGYGTWLGYEVHAYQLVQGASNASLGGLSDGFGAATGGRSGALTHRWYDRGGTVAEVAIDRASVQLYLPFGRVSVGRQPVTLAATYFFTPNDLFQAFSAQAFFRLYKPGVDAARLDIDLGGLSQLSVISVLGYAPASVDEATRPQWDASAVLGRVSVAAWGFEWAALGGKSPFAYLAGGDLQGELFGWLGVRAEGHVAFPMNDGRIRAEVALGLEHRFDSSLHVRAEYFYNGSGADDPADYLQLTLDPLTTVGAPYLGRHYAVVGGSYALTPLLTGDAFALANLSDGSFQLAAAFVYSLADELEAMGVVSVPVGDGLTFRPPAGVRFGSELGTAPIAVSGELRAYF